MYTFYLIFNPTAYEMQPLDCVFCDLRTEEWIVHRIIDYLEQYFEIQSEKLYSFISKPINRLHERQRDTVTFQIEES